MHILRRPRVRGAGQDGRDGDDQGGSVDLVLRGLDGQPKGDLGAVHAGEDLGVQGVPLGAQIAPHPTPARRLDGLAVLQGPGEPQASGADLVVDVDVLERGEIQHAGGGIVLIDAPPAVLAGAAAEGRQAQIVAAADGLGVQAGQIGVARLGPGFGGSDAVGLGHDAEV